MEIISVKFEDNMILDLNGTKISIHPFKEADPNIIKLGVDAPKSVLVNREEIHNAKKKLNRLSSDEKIVGFIKSYNANKGVGFARIRHADDDILIRHTSITNRRSGYNLWEGDKVRMTIRKTQKGLEAAEVEIL